MRPNPRRPAIVARLPLWFARRRNLRVVSAGRLRADVLTSRRLAWLSSYRRCNGVRPRHRKRQKSDRPAPGNVFGIHRDTGQQFLYIDLYLYFSTAIIVNYRQYTLTLG